MSTAKKFTLKLKPHGRPSATPPPDASFPPCSPLTALAILGRELALAQREWQNLADSNHPPHGCLMVIRQSLVRAQAATQTLINSEEAE